MPTSFTPYQVDYTAKNTSKTFGFSKKRVAWKFGIANNQAVAEGLTGANCRGSEHEVIFIWSLNSGKRQILADGKDVHFSESGQNGWTNDQVFQHHFHIRVPNFSSPIRCHLITQPANKDIPSIHPFDLRVNGISYFNFCKIFQLGTSQMVSRPLKGSSRSSRGGSSYNEEDPYCSPDERKAIAAAKLASIRDLKSHEAQPAGASNMNREEPNLINFLDDPTPAPPAPAPRGQGNFVSSVTLDPSLIGGQPRQPPPPGPAYSNYQLPPQQHPGAAPFGQPQPPAPNAYAQHPPPNAYAQHPPPNAYAQHPPAAYGQPPTQNSFAQPPPTPTPSAASFDPMSSNALTPAYGQPPQPQPYSNYQGPPPAQQAPPPAFASPTAGAGLTSPGNQTYASYGSAPSFAQPPQQSDRSTATTAASSYGTAPQGYPPQQQPYY